MQPDVPQNQAAAIAAGLAACNARPFDKTEPGRVKSGPWRTLAMLLPASRAQK